MSAARRRPPTEPHAESASCRARRTAHAERASRCYRRAAAERHAAASAAARPGRRKERQHGAAGSGALERRATATAPRATRRERELQSTTHRARRESEPPPRKSGGRAPRRRERGGTIVPAPGLRVGPSSTGGFRERRSADRAPVSVGGGAGASALLVSALGAGTCASPTRTPLPCRSGCGRAVARRAALAAGGGIAAGCGSVAPVASVMRR